MNKLVRLLQEKRLQKALPLMTRLLLLERVDNDFIKKLFRSNIVKELIKRKSFTVLLLLVKAVGGATGDASKLKRIGKTSDLAELITASRMALGTVYALYKFTSKSFELPLMNLNVISTDDLLVTYNYVYIYFKNGHIPETQKYTLISVLQQEQIINYFIRDSAIEIVLIWLLDNREIVLLDKTILYFVQNYNSVLLKHVELVKRVTVIIRDILLNYTIGVELMVTLGRNYYNINEYINSFVSLSTIPNECWKCVTITTGTSNVSQLVDTINICNDNFHYEKLLRILYFTLKDRPRIDMHRIEVIHNKLFSFKEYPNYQHIMKFTFKSLLLYIQFHTINALHMNPIVVSTDSIPFYYCVYKESAILPNNILEPLLSHIVTLI